MKISLPTLAAILAKYLLSFVSWFKITFYASVTPGVILPAIVFQWNVK
jgi:hypothetical protein